MFDPPLADTAKVGQRGTEQTAADKGPPGRIVGGVLSAGLRLVVDSFPQGAMAVFDRDLRFVMAGGRGLADVGLSRQMLEGRTIWEAFPPEKAALLEPKYRAALSGVDGCFDMANGHHIHLIRVAPVRDDAGEVVAGMLYTQDVTDARRQAEVLRQSELRFRVGFEGSPMGMAIRELDGGALVINAVFAAMIGRTPQQARHLPLAEFVDPGDLHLLSELAGRFRSGELATFSGEVTFIRPDGAAVRAHLSGHAIDDDDGRPAQVLIQIVDVTARKKAERERDAHATMLRAVIDNNQSLIYVKDLDGRYLLANPAFERIFAVAEADLLGQTDVFLDPDLEPVWRQNDLRAQHGAYAIEEWSDAADGRHWYESVKFPLTNADDEVYATCGVSLDVTAGRQAAAELARQRVELEGLNLELAALARQDPLTGLGNRRALQEDLELLQARVGRYGHRYCMALLDVDHFKSYNDAYGHQAGDQVLQAVAAQLQDQGRAGDALYRYGGEEFLCIFPEQSLAAAVVAAERMRRGVERLAISHAHSPLGVLTLSAGLAVLDPGQTRTVGEVLKQADEALYRAKQLGRNRVEQLASQPV